VEVGGRRSDTEAQRTRERILERSIAIAAVEGLGAVTIGRLARDLGMSKAGVAAPFGTREALLCAAVEAAEEGFREAVLEPIREREPGLHRLLAIAGAWIDYVAAAPLGRGGFLEAAQSDAAGRRGRLRERIAAHRRERRAILEAEAAAAIRAGQLPTRLGARQLAFELQAIIAGLSLELQLDRGSEAPERARRAMRRVLGLPPRRPGPKPADRRCYRHRR
jgi:AcrR family transcriptional regulator